MPSLRIASLLPSGTELVCALGLRDCLVGVSHECDFPADVSGLPRLTSSILKHGLTPAQIDDAVRAASLEQRPLYAVDGPLLASLEPDLIVTQGVCAVCAVTEDTVAQSLSFVSVECASAAPVLSLGGVDWAGIVDDLRRLGDATDCRTRARDLTTSLEQRWDRLAATRPSQRPTVVMLEWPEPPWFGGHWVPEQVAVAGGIDPFGEPGRPSRRTHWEAVLKADPDYVIAMACGFDLEANVHHARRAMTGPLASLRAAAQGRVWAADANAYFSRPGPRVVDGAELLRCIITEQSVEPTRARCLTDSPQ